MTQIFLLIILFVLALCVYSCAKAGALTILLAGVLSGLLITSICGVAAFWLAGKVPESGGAWMRFETSWSLIALLTAIYAVPFGIAVSVLLSTAKVVWSLSSLEEVNLGAVFGIVVGLVLWFLLGGGSHASFLAVAVAITTTINSAAIALLSDWLQPPFK